MSDDREEFAQWWGAEDPRSGRLRRGLDEVIRDYLAWSLVQFPGSTPASVAAHLVKEVKELQATPESAEELADIVALAFHSAVRQGHDLAAALDAKLVILKARKWREPDEDGVVEHVREDGEGDRPRLDVKDGRCCGCGYEGQEETVCPGRQDGIHCIHWWEGPQSVAPSGPRFGMRLRAWIENGMEGWEPIPATRTQLLAIAAEIDADAEKEREHTGRYFGWFESHSRRADRAEADLKLARVQLSARESPDGPAQEGSADGPRFGDRLREYAKLWGDDTRQEVLALALEIDADRGALTNDRFGAGKLHAEIMEHARRKDLRRRIEEAVDKVAFLAYEGSFRVVYQADVRAALAEIFGERQAEAVGDATFCPRCGTALVDGECPATHLITVYKVGCAPLLVPDDQLDDAAEDGWFPEEAP